MSETSTLCVLGICIMVGDIASDIFIVSQVRMQVDDGW